MIDPSTYPFVDRKLIRKVDKLCRFKKGSIQIFMDMASSKETYAWTEVFEKMVEEVSKNE